MHKEGHVIAVHTYSHRYRDIYSDVDSYLSDFKKTDDAICKVTGKRSTIFRFPGGSINIFNSTFPAPKHALNLEKSI